MRTAATLVFVLACSTAPAAPAPDAAAHGKEKLEALKGKLPKLLEGWAEKPNNRPWAGGRGGPRPWTLTPEFRVLRRVGPDRAKAVVLFAARDEKGARKEFRDVLLTFRLAFAGGCWTTGEFEVFDKQQRDLRTQYAWLMLEIDELAEK